VRKPKTVSVGHPWFLEKLLSRPNVSSTAFPTQLSPSLTDISPFFLSLAARRSSGGWGSPAWAHPPGLAGLGAMPPRWGKSMGGSQRRRSSRQRRRRRWRSIGGWRQSRCPRWRSRPQRHSLGGRRRCSRQWWSCT
jgi:hypothetical protein